MSKGTRDEISSEKVEQKIEILNYAVVTVRWGTVHVYVLVYDWWCGDERETSHCHTRGRNGEKRRGLDLSGNVQWHYGRLIR